MDKALELIHVSKTYGGAVPTQVLFDVNLSFTKGSFNAIVGSSGSGKSTLLNIIGTLDAPTKGDVIIAGHATKKLNRNQLATLRNQTLGFVFQFHFLLPEYTALENVLMPFWISHQPVTKKIVARAEELLSFMGLEKVRNNLATKMSGGQQQRTAIARALMNNPPLLLADEPTGNLDSETTETTYKLLRSIHAEYKTTFIIITHDRKVAERADRIIEMRDGRVELDIQV